MQLGAAAISAALAQAGLAGSEVHEVYMGNVLGAGLGQNPAAQAARAAGLPPSVNSTTINKVCASGMKAIQSAAASIALGLADVAVAGGMESMSLAPHLLRKTRTGLKYGAGELVDCIACDGLTDAFSHEPMGMAAELCAASYAIGREEQDAYAASSFTRAQAAQASGAFTAELAPVTIAGARGAAVVVSSDEGPSRYAPAKMATLKPAFTPDGTVTPANASTLADGAAALVLVSRAAARARGLRVLAVLAAHADASQEPERFTTSPALAAPRALARAGVAAADVALWEINEAFAVVALANMRLLGLAAERVNVHGGGVSLGHPLGASGARIVVTLVHALRRHHAAGAVGVAAVCNGGGGASALVMRLE